MTWPDLKALAEDKISEINEEDRKDYIERLKYEIKQIEMQAAGDYWVGLYESQSKYESNKNGLVLPYLVGITSVDPIKHKYYYQICEDGKEGDIVIITLEDGKIIEIPIQAIIKIGDKTIRVSELKMGDEL